MILNKLYLCIFANGFPVHIQIPLGKCLLFSTEHEDFFYFGVKYKEHPPNYWIELCINKRINKAIYTELYEDIK